jgi:two-component system OmpR family response regulator
MHILLIEDDERVAGHISAGLQEVGHLVDRSADGRDGLFKAAGEQYDVIILDRMLPRGSWESRSCWARSAVLS